MINSAIQSLLTEFSDNPWFIQTFWPENEPRVRLMLADLQSNVPTGESVLDVGCYNGYFSFLLSKLGYRVTGADATTIEGRDQMFARCGIEFLSCNLNEPSAFSDLAAKSFSAVVMGEVIEHVLNHPLGLMKSVARVTRDKGVLLLTTPNPSTLANAYRTLRGTLTLWGTPQFMDLPKIENARLTDIGDVHYREYRACEIIHLLTESGFTVERFKYFAFGVSRNQPFLKRQLKSNPLARMLMSYRVFGVNQYVLARANGKNDLPGGAANKS
jgi:2-polyprenyl-3-methyl-5-hydroxy-6-metoxy-1,4-benzoquinol methylase